MKNSLIVILFLFTACTNNQNTNSAHDSISNNKPVPEQPTKLCFQRVEGITNQDTSTINLLFNNDKVSGSFNHIPYQKDSRKGAITGTRNGEIIKAVWSFMQEGMTDTISVEFKLSGDELYQKTFGVDQGTGRQKLTDTSTFSIRYQKTACAE